MPQRLLEGEVVDRNDGAVVELQRLRETVARLTRERDDSRREAIELQQRMRNNDAPIARLRQQLEPLYRALQGIWGEFDEIAPDVAPSPSAPAARPQIWESWKSKLGGRQAEFIQILLEHGEMTAAQLKAAAHCSLDTVYPTIRKLSAAGLINKNGSRFSLKQLA